MSLKLICHADIEATCEEIKRPDFFSEVIEFGIVIFDPNKFETVSKHQYFVKPVINPTLTKFCTELTGISQEDVNKGLLIGQAMNEIAKHVHPKRMAFTSWGGYDSRRIIAVAERFRVQNPFPNRHIDLKKEHAKFYKLPKRLGTKGALAHHHLKFAGDQHRALVDAENTARILEIMIREGWEHPYLMA